jgi:hypothetical protein
MMKDVTNAVCEEISQWKSAVFLVS